MQLLQVTDDGAVCSFQSITCQKTVRAHVWKTNFYSDICFSWISLMHLALSKMIPWKEF